MFLFILAIQLMKSGATAVGPSIEGQFPFANGFSTLGTGWLGAYFVLSGSPVAATAISLFGAGTIDQAPDVHDALRLAPGRVVHRAGDRLPVRDEAQGPPSRRLDRHRDPGDDDDRDHLRPRDVDRVLDPAGGPARRIRPARVGQARRDPRQALGTVRRPRRDAPAGVGALPHGDRRDPRLVQPDRPSAAAGQQRRDRLEARRVAEASRGPCSRSAAWWRRSRSRCRSRSPCSCRSRPRAT